MKKLILLLLAAFFCLTNSNAQTVNNVKVRDSLKTLLQKEKQDTSRVMLLYQIAQTYNLNKPDTAMLLASEALSLSQRIGFVKGETSILYGIGGAYVNAGNFPKAMEFWLKALKLNEKSNNLVGKARDLNGIGLIYRQQGDYRQAIEYFLKSIKLTKQIERKSSIAITLGNLGKSYLGLNQYDSARVYAQQAYDLASKNNNPRSTGISLSLMGEIYSQTAYSGPY